MLFFKTTLRRLQAAADSLGRIHALALLHGAHGLCGAGDDATDVVPFVSVLTLLHRFSRSTQHRSGPRPPPHLLLRSQLGCLQQQPLTSTTAAVAHIFVTAGTAFTSDHPTRAELKRVQTLADAAAASASAAGIMQPSDAAAFDIVVDFLPCALNWQLSSKSLPAPSMLSDTRTAWQLLPPLRATPFPNDVPPPLLDFAPTTTGVDQLAKFPCFTFPYSGMLMLTRIYCGVRLVLCDEFAFS